MSYNLQFLEQQSQQFPDDPWTLSCYAYYLQAEQQSEKALKYISRAVELDPSYLKAIILKGEILLTLERYQEGWPYFDQWHNNTGNNENYKKYLSFHWFGEVTNNIVLLWDDGGFGDTIQYLRYIPLVQRRCQRVHVAARPELTELIRNSFPRVTMQPTTAAHNFNNLVNCTKADIRTLKHCAFSSLPHIYNHSIDNIPKNIPYLKATPKYLGRLPSFIQRESKIGFRWDSGSTWPDKYYIKSVPFELAQQILQRTGVISLRQEDLHTKDFLETAEIIAGLDLVITVDTSIAHLAGGLGKPTWLLLSHNCDWRWGQQRTDSAWYPTMKLFRQNVYDDWKGVIDRVTQELTKF